MAFDIVINYREPDYHAILQRRYKMATKLRDNRYLVASLMKVYQGDPVAFIADWGMTYDPRNVESGLPALIPFIPFPEQVRWMHWVLERWHAKEHGLSDKSRDMGLSWCAVALSATLCIFNRNMSIGFGSRKEEYVDSTVSPKALFHKMRQFIKYLPRSFQGGYTPRSSKHMAVGFPESGSVVTGEAGDNIGRGDRQSIYFVDEAAFLERPLMIDASLSNTANCRIDLSSVNGSDNPFAEKRHSWPEHRIFTFHWRADPRKDDAWYARMVENIDNPIIVAQEIDLDYNASKEGVLIPSAWIQAAIDLHLFLGIEATNGARFGALDVADRGRDKNSFTSRKGWLLDYVESWSGTDTGDLYATTVKSMNLCDELNVQNMKYDADGLGAGIRGDARTVNELRGLRAQRQHHFHEFIGGGEVIDKTDQVYSANGKKTGRTNEEYFKNYKAQAWWHLRTLFQTAYRARNGQPYDTSKLISISSEIPYKERTRMLMELSQPTYSFNPSGLMIVDKAPDDARSPNDADSVMMLYAPTKRAKGLGAMVNR